MNRWGRHQVCLSSVVLRPFSLPASNACLCTCMHAKKKNNNKNACMHARSALSTCLPPPSIPLLYIKTKKKKKTITRFFTAKFKCIQLHGLIYSFFCVWTCLASLVEIDTRLLFSFFGSLLSKPERNQRRSSTSPSRTEGKG